MALAASVHIYDGLLPSAPNSFLGRPIGVYGTGILEADGLRQVCPMPAESAQRLAISARSLITLKASACAQQASNP
jgi:hypothetical protein